MKNLIIYSILLLVCVLSRMLSPLDYSEDLQSFNLASCIAEGHINRCAGNLPFVFLANLIYTMVPNLPMTFSVLGGISLFLLIIFVLKMVNAPLLSLEGGLIAILIFFNPLVWIMSNRYSPDLLATALLSGAVYFFLANTSNTGNQYLAWFTTGLLAGIKPCYLIILIIPAAYAWWKGKNYFSMVFLFAGLGLWIVPVLLWGNKLADLAGYQFLIDPGWWTHLKEILKDSWASGLSGYWPGRRLYLIPTSLATLVCLFFGALVLFDYGLDKKKLLSLSLGFCLYLLVLCFSAPGSEYNLLLPLIPFFCILISYGIIYFIVNFNHLAVKISILGFLLINICVAIYTAAEHTKPSALAQTKEYLEQNFSQEPNLLIVTDPQTQAYLEAAINASYIRKLSTGTQASKLISIGGPLPGKTVKNQIRFHHDPFINRLSPDVNLYEY
ncbi:MAG: hypothetical protein ACJ75J_15575 [Cytophagaceae bacterium]